MYQRRLLGDFAACLAITLTLMAVPVRASGVPTGPASPAAAAAVNGYPGEITKVTLDDTSIDGPALWTTTSGTTRSVIAWTGTDSAHHLNVMTSGIGTLYGNKKTLPETSFVRPAVARTSDGKVVMAWTGTDPNHSLNLIYDVYGSYIKRTLADTSFTAPAVDLLGGNVILAWAGTDPNHTLNTFSFSVPGLSPIRKTTLPAQYSSDASPGLSFDPLGAALGRNKLIISWSARAPDYRLRFATSNDAASWTLPTTLDETSYAGSGMIGIPSSDASYMPGHYVTWTGTDRDRSVNVQYTDNFYNTPSWPNPTATKATLPETALGGTQMGFIGGPKQTLVAWTGTDPEHHLNLTVVAPSNPCSVPGASSVATDVIYHGNTSKRQVALTFDAGGESGPQTTKILDVLERRGVHATWFFEGAWAQDHPGVVQRVRADGFDIGNHTVTHPHFPKSPAVSNNYICYELTLDEQIIADVTGGRTTRPYFRPPYGDLGPIYTYSPTVTSQVSTVAGQLGYRTIMWSVDPRDWETTITVDQILSRVLNSANLQNGAIILLHAGGLHTGDALDQLITALQQKGFTLVSLTEVLQ